MNTLTKQLIGAAIGGAIGYFIGGVVVEVIALQQLKKYENWDWDGVQELTEEGPEEQGPLTMAKPKKRNYTKHFTGDDRPELAALVAKYNGDPIEEKVDHIVIDESTGGEEEYAVLSDGFEIYDEDEIVSDIMVISLAEYAENVPGYECMTLNYYDDDVVTDEHDNPINRPEQILGEEALVSFGELSDDEEVVYVRNIPRKAMYEVVKTNKLYAAPPAPTRRELLAQRREARQAKKEERNEEANPK